MCTTCGCGGGEARIEGERTYRHAAGPAVGVAPAGGHWHADGTFHADHDHAHGHAHDHAHDHAHGHAHGPLGAAHAPGTSAERILAVEQDILAKNDAIAAANRRRLATTGVFALNLVSSPGSGKTTLLCRTIEAWGATTPVAVIEGDQQTSVDADRIRATGAPAIQVNTGKGCHLDASMVARALDTLPPAEDSVLFIENVGNLVCPAAFDLGEAHKVAILSVTEGEDKPLKYPDMFRAADLLLLNKVDLLPYVAFDVAKAAENARRVRPGLEVIEVSATTGAGFDRWLAWLRAGAARAREGRSQSVERLERRVAELEARLAAPGNPV